jgi:GNAT superfamily N-acetyltransferase
MSETSYPGIKWQPRLADEEDIPALKLLIPLSVYGLQSPSYSKAQMEAALGCLFAVDRQLILDGTYFVVEEGPRIVGCGGWSKRESFYRSDNNRGKLEAELNPSKHPARIRAFYVHPEWARRGIGRCILNRCEQDIAKAGFSSAEIVATLVGEPLYASFGYRVKERHDIPLTGGVRLPVVRMGKDAILKRQSTFLQASRESSVGPNMLT